MGKVTRWFRSLLSSKRSAGKDQKSNSKWGFLDSSGTSIKFHTSVEDPLASPYTDGLDANKHAIAVAAATAAVAEAALAAAQAAAEVVRLTSGGGSTRTCIDRRLVLAALRIQSSFRAYLARRALRALKGLVKLQALIRGHIVRKQSTNMLRRMQAMARIQARASAHRCYTSEYSTAQTRFSISHHFGNSNLRKHDVEHGRPHLKQCNLGSPITNGVGKERSRLAPRWLNHWMENTVVDDGRSDKILEIDSWKPRQNPNKASPASHYISAWNGQGEEHPRLSPSSRLSSKPNPSMSSEEVASVLSSKLPLEDPFTAWTADNSPRLHSASSRPTSHRPFSPARSECSKSLFADYLGHRNYMANTESSQAKARSHSAPKQRIPIEELGWGAKFGRGHWESDVFEKGSTLSTKQRTNTHIYTGQVRRQGASTRDVAATYSSMYGIRQ